MSWRAGLALALVMSALGLVTAWQLGRHPRPRAQLPLALTPGQPIELATLPRRAPRWLVQLDGARGLDLVAHPPLVLGDRVIIAGSRVGWAALSLDRGAPLWRHPASPALSAPLPVTGGLLVVDVCPAEAVASAGTVLACGTVLAPSSGQVQATLTIAADDVAGCEAARGAWGLRASGDSIRLERDPCRFELTLADGVARRLPDRAAAASDDPDRIVLDPDQLPWRRALVAGAPVVIDPAGARVVPGLTVLAADAGGPGGVPPAATVVRRDSTLRHDLLVGGSWWWPLPELPAGRGGPVAVTSSRAATVVLFDGDRVAAFAP